MTEIEEHFRKQVAEGATDMFFYGLEEKDGGVWIKSHRGKLETFPKLEYVKHMTEGMPLFRRGENESG